MGIDDVLENESGNGTRYLKADRVVVDLLDRKIWCDAEEKSVTTKTFDLLVLLMTSAQELVTKDRLFDEIWDGKSVSESVLTTAVKDARRALGDKARSPDYLETVHGHGYRFLKTVEAVETLEAEKTDAPVESTVAMPPAADPASAPKMRFGLIGAAALIIISLVAFIVSRPGDLGAPQPNTNETRQQSIAVLPFDDFSQNQNQRWFGDGLAEEILNTLAAYDDLLVASRRSAFEYRGPGTDIREIAKNLGVTHVLEGSVRNNNNDDKIRITVQLIRASDGFHIWSETYDRNIAVSDLFDIQEEISKAIATKLGLAGAVKSMNSSFTNSTDAYQAFLRAKELLRRRDASSVPQAIAEFEGAIDLDPEFGPAYAGLGEALIYSVMYAQSDESWEELQPTIKIIIDQALSLAPSSSDALRAASFFALVTQRHDDALGFANSALINNPNDVDAYQRRAVILVNINRIEDSLRDLYSALEREPVSPIIMLNITQIESDLGNIDAATKIAQKNLEINPDNFLAHSGMAMLHLKAGEYVSAQQSLLRAKETNPHAEPVTRSIEELKWRLGYFGEDNFPDEKFWTATGAHYLEIGQKDKTISLARENEQYVKSGMSSHIFYYWSGQNDDAYRLAQLYAERVGLTTSSDYKHVNVEDIVSIIRIFELANDEQATLMRTQYAKLIDGKKPSDFSMPDRMYLVATWHKLNGDVEESLRWIDAMLDREFVPREMKLDPIFDNIRSEPRFQERISRMNEIAEMHRQKIGAMP